MSGSYFFGIFPRSEKLIDITRSKEDYFEDLRREAETIVNYQIERGFKIISDPQMTWEDIFRPIALSSEGIKVNGLNRYFETNTFYKVPVISSRPRLNEEKFKLFLMKGTNLISLPDPFTFACLSRDERGSDRRALIKELGDLLAEASGVLRDAGYRYLVLRGPSYGACEHLQASDEIKEAIRSIKDEFMGNVVLHFYFFKSMDSVDLIVSSGVDGLGFDMYVYGEEEIRKASARMKNKLLVLGAVDGTNTKMERMDDITRLLSIFKDVNPMVSNNVDLEFLPQKFALKKVDLLAELSGVTP
ncbi:MAG: hypothetical protein ACP5LW_02300 [Nitrososphaeria archaeon]